MPDRVWIPQALDAVPAPSPGRCRPLDGDNGVVTLTATCLCLLTRMTGDGVSEVLLGRKKTGFGRGKIVAVGGHVEAGETPAEAAAREVREESGIHVLPAALTAAADLTFLFPARPDWDMTVAIFTADAWSGEAVESGELAPQWFEAAALPYELMWDDAPLWLPRVLAGERLRASFSYAEDNETVASHTVGPR
jgi:8-oxo-dGTP diphosphatase